MNVANAVKAFAEENKFLVPVTASECKALAERMEQGELILCEYVDTELEKGEEDHD